VVENDSLWRNRSFVVLWVSQFVSSAGSRVSTIAYPLLVLATTHSPRDAGLVGFCASIPFPFCFPLAGVLADRIPRKQILIVSDAGRAVAIGSIPLAAAFGGLTLAQIATVALVEGALFAFFTTAESAAVPQVVPKAQVPGAVARNQAREQAAVVVGQPIGGALFGIARTLPFVADAVSYLASIALIATLPARLEDEREPRPFTLFADIREGLRYIVDDAFMRYATLSSAIGNLVLGGIGLALVVKAQSEGASPALVGAMFGLFGAGGVAGAQLAVRFSRSPRIGSTIIGSIWLWAVLAVGMPLVSSPVALGVLAAGVGASVVVFNVANRTYRYATTPDALIGRIMSVGRIVSFATLPLGSALAGLAIAAWGANAELWGSAALIVVDASFATASRAVRSAYVR
jgi:predicted MFS family arabinose efflux permease